MVRALLVRGMLAGLLGGLLTFAFARIFAEPLINDAITFEVHLHQNAGDAPEPELVSRAVQSTIGLLVGIVVYSCALGGIFALVFAYAQGRLGRIGARGTATFLAAAAFVVLFLVPQLKYPANPPSIGDPETIRVRTMLYLAMIVWFVMAAILALLVYRRLLASLGTWNASLIGAALYMVAVAAGMLTLSPVDEVPAAFPASLLWQFRIVSLGGHAVLLATIGLMFGSLARPRPLAKVAITRR